MHKTTALITTVIATVFLVATANATPPAKLNAQKIAILKKIYNQDYGYQYDVIKKYGTPATKSLLYKAEQTVCEGNIPNYADFDVAFRGGNDPLPRDLKSIKYTALKNGQIQVTSKTLPGYYQGFEGYTPSFPLPTVRYQFVCKQKCLIDDIIVVYDNKGDNVSFKQELIKDLNTDWGFCQ